MQRILIGSSLVILCAAVAAAQSPPGTTPSLPGAAGPGAIAPGAVAPGTVAPGKLQTISPSLTPQIVSPSIKKGTPSIAPGSIAPAALPAPSLQTQSLMLTNGSAINAVFDRNTSSFKVDLQDGTYKTTNGGAIRVKGGVIVWDAFGVIERLNIQKKKGQGVAEAPVGIA
jgi:hypothetical protein